MDAGNSFEPNGEDWKTQDEQAKVCSTLKLDWRFFHPGRHLRYKNAILLEASVVVSDRTNGRRGEIPATAGREGHGSELPIGRE